MLTVTHRAAGLGLLIVAALAGCAHGLAPEEASKITVAEVRVAELEKAIKEHKGKVILVDCWATWCAPCVKKFPKLVERHQKYASRGLVCMSVSMDKLGAADQYSREKVLKFLQEKRATFPNFILIQPDKDEEALVKLIGDCFLIPHLALFDRQGRRIWTSADGPELTDEQLDKKIEQLLADNP
ncbi:MAG: redoxin domain-containing protein [Gemmataceae bacterium]|nr:redoxin domain-containing protein [Gemmataceae bacterium]MCS7270375.1 redoxin domain-containing protein [Gemmataceae bacterium]MDW8244206.1 redoxin domain-containing protein [Thermogemmata sp.]